MRIIKYGRDPSMGAHYVVNCTHCRTKFEFHTGEALLRPDPRDGDYYEAECPVCKHAVTKAVDRRHYA